MADRCLAAIGNYTISKLKLGKGSFSTVKLARHNNLGSDVAMKIIVLSRIKDPYVTKNLQREAAILDKLRHPKVVRLFEVVTGGAFYCLALEYFPGGSLCEMMQDKGRLEETLARSYFRQIVSGLRYIHNQVSFEKCKQFKNIGTGRYLYFLFACSYRKLP